MVSNAHSNSRIAAYVRKLKRCEAPQALISDFEELVKIENRFAFDFDRDPETLDRSLLMTCRKFNFAIPFDREGQRAYFPPAYIDDEHPDYRADSPNYVDFNIHDEQAYRRGFCEGFEDAVRYLDCDDKSLLAARRNAIHNWGAAKVWFGASSPGTIEPFDIEIGSRSKVPAKLRWKILERDQRKCVACGASPDQGAILQIDHIVSVYNGGSNDEDNLQTLCAVCNLGKGKG